MTEENRKELLNIINNKEFLEKFNITEKDIFKAIKLGLDELQELQKLVNEEKRKGTSFEELFHKLHGKNGEFQKETSSQKYFDLNYKSIFVTIFENNETNNYDIEKSCVHFYPDNIADNPSTYLFILDLTEPFDLYEFANYMEEDMAQELLKEHYNKIENVEDTYIIAYVLEAGSDFGVKYIRKAEMNDKNLQHIFNEGKDMFNSVDCSKFKIAIFNKNNNQYITSYSPDKSNFERRYEFKEICENIKKYNYPQNYNLKDRICWERLCNNQIQEKCLENGFKNLEEIPDIEHNIKINSKYRLLNNEVLFEDGIIIEGNVINAYISLDGLQVEKSFGLKELNYDSEYYDVYFNYDFKNKSSEIEIVCVTDTERKYYTYLPKEDEASELIRQLDEYCKSIEGKTLEDIIKEEQEREQE